RCSTETQACIDEPAKQDKSEFVINSPFRVPLDADEKRVVIAPHRFKNAIRRRCNDAHRTAIAQSLTMVAVDLAEAKLASDLVALLVPMHVSGRQRVGEILIQISARVQSHQLHAQAYPQRRFFLPY